MIKAFPVELDIHTLGKYLNNKEIIMSNLEWLQNWIKQNYNIISKIKNRFSIDTLDNPGWILMFELKDSPFENQSFDKIIIDRDEINWCHCLIKNNRFSAAGGPLNLNEILMYFKNWIEKKKNNLIMNDEIINWIQNWYFQHCDGDWEHTYGIKIGTLDNPGWRISISLKETELEKKTFNKLKIERNEDNWIHCFIKNNCFEIACGVLNFEEGLKIFRDWVEVECHESLDFQ